VGRAVPDQGRAHGGGCAPRLIWSGRCRDSNHGGRQLDNCVATIDALPEIVEAVGHSLVVLIDGGFRRGADIVKALALGAKGVLLGGNPVWAGSGRSAWVAKSLSILRRGGRSCLPARR
jgi:isopentenyl diphosphate isomerase/L-lactate dehydrogenase-like FMN-dependent dehydrogenase